MNSFRILIVDDHPKVRQMLCAAFDSHDRFEVVGEARDGFEAVDLVTSIRPDVVLLDVSMPGRDGIATLPHLHEANPDTAIIVFTATGTARKREADIAAAYLTKGDPLDQTMAEIVSVLEARALPRLS